MLPKNRRIQKKLFSNVVLTGKRHNSQHFLVYINKIDNKHQSLFSFSISKKICKSAVGRNRLRRQGYSVISKYLNNILPGFTVFFSFKKGSTLLKFKDLEIEILSILKESKVLNV